LNYDDTNIPDKYDQGRDHGPAVTEQWMNAVAMHVEAAGVRDILDLGCGTGRFTQALAEKFDARVFGIDPSMKMLSQAQAKRTDNRVAYALGTAEAIPLPAATVDMVFISMVFHHFTDRQRAAEECRRALRDNGRVFLRTSCPENIALYPYVPFFPSTLAVLKDRLPSLDDQSRAFEAAAFRPIFSGIVTQQIAPDYATYAAKLATGSDSIIASLDKVELAAGLQALRAAGEAAPATPVVEPIDFIVFERGY